MNQEIVRLLELKINNIKNVKNGEIDLINYSNIKNNFNLKIGDILGIYGQNGSGKTTVVDVMGILKNILIGEKLTLNELISIGEKNCTLAFKFYIEILQNKYIVDYKIQLEKTDKEVIINNETIKYRSLNEEKWTKNQTLIEIPYNLNGIKPKTKFAKILNNEKILIDLKVAEGISKKMNTSFLFSKDIKDIFEKVYSTDTDLILILETLKRYGMFDLFVVTNKEIGMINLNIFLPLRIKRTTGSGSIPISIGKNEENIIVDETVYTDVQNTVEEINIVLKTIIPDMSLRFFEQKRELVGNNAVNIVAELVSVRGKDEIPLRNESDGIKRIVSILGALIGAYNQRNVCLVIDEIDSGVFEYLLGELLEIFSLDMSGQIIFTSHNLRILEKIKKESVVFTTTNPDNRYVRLKYVKPNNNLRDLYLREMIIQEQDEELYKETDSYEIRRSLYKAGVINAKKG
ncbi:AAA family ATPase [Cetobacterium sp.]|uniref:AAA family ATPase n=1 Tax=Cetobacterium sp. TaxID=2071632 RepID=UPI003F3C5FA0